MIEGNSSSWLEGKKLYRVNKDGTTGDVDMMIRNNRRGAAMLLYFLTFFTMDTVYKMGSADGVHFQDFE